MISKNHIRWFSIILIFILRIAGVDPSFSNDFIKAVEKNRLKNQENIQNETATRILDRLNSEFQASVISGDTSGTRMIINNILENLDKKEVLAYFSTHLFRVLTFF